MNKTKKIDKKRLCQTMAVLTLIVSVLLPTIINIRSDAGNTVTIGSDSVYTILSDGNRTVEYVGSAKKTCTTVYIPATIKVGGKDYKVVSIKAGALKGNKDLIKVTIGKNVKTIGKKAFYGCKDLKRIIIESKGLTSKSVAKDAFKQISGKGDVIVPKSKYASYKNILSASGVSGKWKVKKDSVVFRDDTTWDNYDPSEPLPDPEYATFGLNADGYLIPEENGYLFGGKRIPVAAMLKLDGHMYGNWYKEVSSDKVAVKCGECGKMFETQEMDGTHAALMNCYSNYICGELGLYDAWFFYPDDAPCKVVYEFTLPEGLDYKDGSLKVASKKFGNVVKNGYDLQVSGRTVTVTINDIKSELFYNSFKKEAYDKQPYTYYGGYNDAGLLESSIQRLIVSFDTWFNGKEQPRNTITGTVTYSYKGNSKTIDLGELVVRDKSNK